MALDASLISVMSENLSKKDYSGYVWESAAQSISGLIQQKTQQRLEERQRATELFKQIDPKDLI
jgi:hypothetical protein